MMHPATHGTSSAAQNEIQKTLFVNEAIQTFHAQPISEAVPICTIVSVLANRSKGVDCRPITMVLVYIQIIINRHLNIRV